MKIIKQSHDVLAVTEGWLKLIELAGRTCYKSEHKIHADSAEPFIKNIVKSKHYSVIEHMNISVRIITDRGIMAELTRHRLASFSIESTRYCRYKNGVTFVLPVEFYNDVLISGQDRDYPPELLTEEARDWFEVCEYSEKKYLAMLEKGKSPELARSVLNHSVKTTIVMTANIREWLHILRLRTSKAAHPQFRALMEDVKADFQSKFPVFFQEA